MSLVIDYSFRFPVDSYSVWSDVLPSWVIKGAEKFSKANGFSFTKLLTCPCMLQPVHDSLHFYTGVTPSLEDEYRLAALEVFIKNTSEIVDEPLLQAWNSLEQYQKDWYKEFYSLCEIGEDQEAFEYKNDYKDALYLYDKDLYDKHITVK